MARYGDDTNRDRWRDEDRERSSRRSGSQGTSEREDERGFFERAGDEVRSWFSDEDDRGPGRDYERGRSSEWLGGGSWDRDRDQARSANRDFGGGMSNRDREGGYGRMGRDTEDRSSFGGMAQGGRRSGSFAGSSGSFSRENERGFGPSRGGGEWRSMSHQDRSNMGGQGASRSDRDRSRGGHPQSWGEANRGQSGGWSRGNDRDRESDQESFGYGSAMGGTMGGFGNQTFGSSQDDHYRSWRDRQMSELDRDYDDYCREREQKFHSDFDSWRRNRPNQSPSASTNAQGSDVGASANAGVGTTTSSMTGTAGAGSAGASGSSVIGGNSPSSSSTGDATSQNATADTGTGSGGRSGSRSRG